VAGAVPCRLVPVLQRGRGCGAGAGDLRWTHLLEVDDTVDVRDGCTRGLGGNALTYADGDEVRVPDAAGTRYAVVWVELLNRGTVQQFKRVYLMRDTAVWPGP